MGLLSRIKRKLTSIAEEANHPGRPPPHKESENPFYAQERAPVKPPEAPTPTDRPWYLDGSQEGWDDTNPDKG